MNSYKDAPASWCLSAAFRCPPPYLKNWALILIVAGQMSNGDKDSWPWGHDGKSKSRTPRRPLNIRSASSLDHISVSPLFCFGSQSLQRSQCGLQRCHRCWQLVSLSSGLQDIVNMDGRGDPPEAHSPCNWSCTDAIFCLIKDIQCENWLLHSLIGQNLLKWN